MAPPELAEYDDARVARFESEGVLIEQALGGLVRYRGIDKRELERVVAE